MNETAIEWAEATWNPTTGCTKVSPGCDHCYAEGIARRFSRGFELTLHPERLSQPYDRRAPSRIFVDSMSDLFHADVDDAFIGRVFAVMADTPRHTYLILTKRPGRMRSWVRKHLAAPLANVWLGTSVESQRWADVRVPILRATPAAVRFLSCEPLLGPVDLDGRLAGIHWVIVGGESGSGARPMNPDWVRGLLADCRAAGTAPFVKQLGSCHGPRKGGDMTTWPTDLRVREYPAAVEPEPDLFAPEVAT